MVPFGKISAEAEPFICLVMAIKKINFMQTLAFKMFPTQNWLSFNFAAESLNIFEQYFCRSCLKHIGYKIIEADDVLMMHYNLCMNINMMQLCIIVNLHKHKLRIFVCLSEIIWPPYFMSLFNSCSFGWSVLSETWHSYGLFLHRYNYI